MTLYEFESVNTSANTWYALVNSDYEILESFYTDCFCNNYRLFEESRKKVNKYKDCKVIAISDYRLINKTGIKVYFEK